MSNQHFKYQPINMHNCLCFITIFQLMAQIYVKCIILNKHTKEVLYHLKRDVTLDLINYSIFTYLLSHNRALCTYPNNKHIMLTSKDN